MSQLQELIAYVRKHSPFYAEFYKNVPDTVTSIEQVPILDLKAFWGAHGFTNSRVLTTQQPGGFALRSGGSTGKPKFSVYSREEWQYICQENAYALIAAGMTGGSRVANLGAVGDLSAGFVFYSGTLYRSQIPLLEYPMGSHTPAERAWISLHDCGIDTMIGASALMIKLIEYYKANRKSLPEVKIDKILFFGEHMTPTQAQTIREVFPNIHIRSAGHTASDVGVMGYTANTERLSEHRVFSRQAILEIVDLETNEVIREPGRPGRLLVTNLIRRTMPLIRYSVGDVCEWTEPEGKPDRSYALLNRVPEAWNLASASFTFQDVAEAAEALDPAYGVSAYQIRLTQFDNKDKLTIRLGVSDPAKHKAQTDQVIEHFKRTIPKMGTIVNNKETHPVELEWLKPEDLAINPRTGKYMRVIDDRK